MLNRSGGGAPAPSPDQQNRRRSPSPAATKLFGEFMTEDDFELYEDMLQQFNGDESAMEKQVDEFFSEYNRNPDEFERIYGDDEEDDWDWDEDDEEDDWDWDDDDIDGDLDLDYDEDDDEDDDYDPYPPSGRDRSSSPVRSNQRGVESDDE